MLPVHTAHACNAHTDADATTKMQGGNIHTCMQAIEHAANQETCMLLLALACEFL
jgi:hypothetical protein